MNRNFRTEAVILSARQFGEDNRIITLLTPDKGVIDAVLYGGRKSKLRALVSPFHSGTIWLYNDETRHSLKITDFEVNAYRPTFREDLYKNCVAAFCAELVIKTKGGNSDGEYAMQWKLVNGFFDGLDLSSRKDAEIGTLRFIWRYLMFLGVQPDIFNCGCCGENLIRSDSGKTNENLIYYDIAKQCFLCHECSSGLESSILLDYDGLNYLQSVSLLTPHEVRKLMLSNESYCMLHDFLFFIISRVVDVKLKTLEAGKGIL